MLIWTVEHFPDQPSGMWIVPAESSDSDRCEQYTTYQKTLAKATSQKADTEAPAHSHTNHQYLSLPQKVARIKELQHNNRVSQKRIDRLSKRIELIARSGACLDDDMNGDLKEIMKQYKGQCLIQSMIVGPLASSSISLPLNQSHLRLHVVTAKILKSYLPLNFWMKH